MAPQLAFNELKLASSLLASPMTSGPWSTLPNALSVKLFPTLVSSPARVEYARHGNIKFAPRLGARLRQARLRPTGFRHFGGASGDR